MNTSKIIKAYIGAGTYSTTEPITQGDYGYILQIEGAELPPIYRVDFSNDRHNGEALPVYGNENGVEVPEEFIATGKDIFAFYFYIEEGFGKTAYTWKIPNDTRAQNGDREPTPTQQDSIDQLIVRSNEAVTSAEQSAEEAGQSAQSASEDAGRAERAKTDAETAQRKAEEAQESAERAKDDAETSERNASESERQAKGYAETASEKANSIHSMTASAQTLPDGSSATVSYDAETGVMLFGIPKGKDGTNGDDGYSPTASVSKSGKVATITITDQNGTTTAQVEDGTDGTDGVSPTVTITSITGGHRIAITDADGTETADVMDGDDYVLTEQDKEEIAEIATDNIEPLYLKAFPTDTASGAVASFPDGADGIPLKSLVVDINPVQDTSSGDPSPENICPISGWTQVDVNHSDADMTNPTTITIDLGQTVYGGHLDVLSGVLTVTDACDTFDGSNDEGWIYYSVAQGNLFRLQNYSAMMPTVNVIPAISNAFKTVSQGSRANGTISSGVGGTNVDFIYSGADSLASWKTWLASNNVQLCYKLAEPIEIQLSANQINSLYGVNNIWADSGDTEVEYRADTKLYINRLTEPDSDMIADANITSGKYFMVGNSLYKATANIANGSAIIVGTNCIRKSLSEALNEINA